MTENSRNDINISNDEITECLKKLLVYYGKEYDNLLQRAEKLSKIIDSIKNEKSVYFNRVSP